MDGDVKPMNSEDTEANLWLENLDGKSVQIWREALEHLRHLSDEVWKVFKCFMGINGFILAFVIDHIAMKPGRRITASS